MGTTPSPPRPHPSQPRDQQSPLPPWSPAASAVLHSQPKDTSFQGRPHCGSDPDPSVAIWATHTRQLFAFASEGSGCPRRDHSQPRPPAILVQGWAGVPSVVSVRSTPGWPCGPGCLSLQTLEGRPPSSPGSHRHRVKTSPERPGCSRGNRSQLCPVTFNQPQVVDFLLAQGRFPQVSVWLTFKLHINTQDRRAHV